jgi:hypothetical protein
VSGAPQPVCGRTAVRQSSDRSRGSFSFASGGSSPEGQVSRMAWALASSVLWQGSVCLPSRRPPSGLSHRVKGPELFRRRGFAGPLTRRDRATPGRRDGRQHSGWSGLTPPYAACDRQPLRPASAALWLAATAAAFVSCGRRLVTCSHCRRLLRAAAATSRLRPRPASKALSRPSDRRRGRHAGGLQAVARSARPAPAGNAVPRIAQNSSRALPNPHPDPGGVPPCHSTGTPRQSPRCRSCLWTTE